MSSVSVFDQYSFERELSNWLLGSEIIILEGNAFTLTSSFITQELRGYSKDNKPKLFLPGSTSLTGGTKQFIWNEEYNVKNVILTSNEKINLLINNKCDFSTLDIDANQITVVNLDDSPEEATADNGKEKGIDVFSQDELDEIIENNLGVVNLYGDIFIVPSSASGFTFVGKNEHTIIILKGEDDCLSAKMDDDDNDWNYVYQFDTFLITLENVIVSSDKKVELVFSTEEQFENWKSVTYDFKNIEIVIREDEYGELSIKTDNAIKADMDFLRKYKAKFIGIDGDGCFYDNVSEKLSYEDACASYYKTKLKVGAIISAKLKGGYRRYGIFGGKNRIISVCPNTDLVSVLDHDQFLAGTGFFNASSVYRMGYKGDESRTLKECYEHALTLLGSEYSDDESFVKACRFSPDNECSLEEMDDDAMQFLSDL